MENKSIINLTNPHSKEEIEKRILELKKTKKVIATSGYFDPLHFGHVELLTLSKKWAIIS